MTERLMTPADVARVCQVSTKTVTRAIRAGRLVASRLGTRGAYRIRPSDVDAWLAGSIITPNPSAVAPPPAIRLPVPRRREQVSGRLVVTEEMGRR